jgi:hypothetical protein
MKKAEEKIKAMISEKQLKIVNDQQNKLSGLLRSMGILDVQKQNIHGEIKKLSEEIEATKKELEEEYGQININLEDGSYTDIEKENEE